ncbi:MAG: hypothetical protein ABIK98_16165 [Pseudomonadota bacterium]|uniref:Uncharacterized protein n=1 Tax=Candidatus Desulfatibia profunda TaxID=2841695 RepID=A0A8J6TMX8_9BACT|nr:hypothetical protein [Candidatus Desulfatibia profunda]MBL7179518.1 hypothetical protein [Desulfobacterales bacterium]MBU0698186.1 hypothetical protein [Pseudomonadota bacterium]
MIYDSLGSLPLPQAVEIKLEKKHQTEEPRAIEDSNQSDDSKFDIHRENVAKESAVKDSLKEADFELETYNAKGNLARELSSEEYPNCQQGSLDLVV